MTAPTIERRPVLLAHSEPDARRWRKAYPDRWQVVVKATSGPDAARGYFPASVDVTPMAAETRGLGHVLDHLISPVFGEVPVSYLPR